MVKDPSCKGIFRSHVGRGTSGRCGLPVMSSNTCIFQSHLGKGNSVVRGQLTNGRNCQVSDGGARVL